MPNSKASFYFCDLFAGIGGFALALEKYGGSPAVSVELDHVASSTYERNFGVAAQGDVVEVAKNPESLPAFSVLVGGFPCQPFSKSGAQRGVGEARGNLFDSIAAIVEAKKPLVVVLENVRNLAGPNHRPELDRIVETFRSMGYLVSSEPSELSPHKLPKENGGSPQSRPRIFITATYAPDLGAEYPADLTPAVLNSDFPDQDWNLVADLPLDSPATSPPGLSALETAWIDAWDSLIRELRANNVLAIPGFPLWTDYWVNTLPREVESYPAWKKSFVMKNYDFYMANSQLIEAWLLSTNLRSFPKTKRKFEWQAGDLSSPWDGLIQFRPSGIRVKPATHAPALVAMNQTSIFGPYRRRLTVREVARLQGFPEGYQFDHQPEAAAFKQLGNAVHVGVVAKVFESHCLRDAAILQRTSEGNAILQAIREVSSQNK